jgi:6-phosphogluconolactonase/glucosamine-6-phosphate isomerase/deaminase
MGVDLHVAGIFQESRGNSTIVAETENIVVTERVEDREARFRVSLNIEALVHADSIFVLLTGIEKWEKLNNELKCASEAPFRRLIEAAGSPITIWFAP